MVKKNIPTKMKGVALAIATAGLVSSCSAITPTGDTAAVDLIHCYGVNVCGGHNDCKTADNSCGGQASCKGTGFVKMPAKACADIGGNQTDSWIGEVAKADLIHCYGVNVCGGHNDCKTADNGCGGQASCKGTGFVNMPAKACTDIGGKNG
ncbi:FIG01058289: hypothetical protein [uncultured Candidatus Thioglobus sp.]|nr:FIG01058289: hypothetical protein [uncultured Candidatus Thioglobus sp.]